MKANRSIGEFVISVEIQGEVQEFLFRPSFFSISSIGSPKEIHDQITDCFNLMSGEFGVMPLLSCLNIIRSCLHEGDNDLLFELTGQYTIGDNNRIAFDQGILSPDELVILSNHLVKWGVIGNPSGNKKPSKSNSSTFDPSEYVSVAIAHLGISPDDAWNLTMTEFQRIVDAKYPEKSNVKDSQDIPENEYNNLMKAHDEIMRKRATKKNNR